MWSSNSKPEVVPELKEKKIVDIAISWTHIAAVTGILIIIFKILKCYSKSLIEI